jgi:hypothetical protein
LLGVKLLDAEIHVERGDLGRIDQAGTDNDFVRRRERRNILRVERGLSSFDFATARAAATLAGMFAASLALTAV